jgi:hypothetical protein
MIWISWKEAKNYDYDDENVVYLSSVPISFFNSSREPCSEANSFVA